MSTIREIFLTQKQIKYVILKKVRSYRSAYNLKYIYIFFLNLCIL